MERNIEDLNTGKKDFFWRHCWLKAGNMIGIWAPWYQRVREYIFPSMKFRCKKVVLLRFHVEPAMMFFLYSFRSAVVFQFNLIYAAFLEAQNNELFGTIWFCGNKSFQTVSKIHQFGVRRGTENHPSLFSQWVKVIIVFRDVQTVKGDIFVFEILFWLNHRPPYPCDTILYCLFAIWHRLLS